MILSDTRLHRAAKHQQLIEPYDPEMVQPNSIEVTLGEDNLVIWKETNSGWEQVEQPLPYDMPPNTPVVLGVTAEWVNVPRNLSGILTGKSTLARMGVSNHKTAGLLDSGFSGRIVLELSNQSPVPFPLKAGMKIGQISFWDVSGPVKNAYGDAGNHYQRQDGVLTARLESLER